MCPRAADALARDPQAEVVVLAVGIEDMLDDFGVAAGADTGDDVGALLLGVEVVAVAELEELHVATTAVHVAADALQAAEEQRLAQHGKVLRERIQQAHTVLGLVALLVVVVGSLGERVVENLVEAGSHQLLGDEVLQLEALINITLDGDGGIQ